jgi:hypothetical protein
MHTLNKMQSESKGKNSGSAPYSLDLTHAAHNFQHGKEVPKRFCLSGPLSLLFDGYKGLFPGSKMAQPLR